MKKKSFQTQIIEKVARVEQLGGYKIHQIKCKVTEGIYDVYYSTKSQPTLTKFRITRGMI